MAVLKMVRSMLSSSTGCLQPTDLRCWQSGVSGAGGHVLPALQQRVKDGSSGLIMHTATSFGASFACTIRHEAARKCSESHLPLPL